MPLKHRAQSSWLTLALVVGLLAIINYVAASRLFRVSKALPIDLDSWFKYEFTEIKAICQQFLTVVVGVLVFSVAFSEKIVRYESASESQRIYLRVCWYCCGGAIVGGGSSLAMIMMAGAFVRYPGSGDYEAAQAGSFALLGISGPTFALGLISLLLSGVAGSRATPRNEPAAEADEEDGTG